MKKIRKIIVACIISLFVFMTTSCVRQIKDTNGPNDYSLSTFTDEEKIECRGSTAIGTFSTHVLGKGTFNSKKFSGGETLYNTNLDSNEYLTCEFNVDIKSGNLEIIFINNDKIIALVPVNTTSRFSIYETGDIKLKIIGESANFKMNYELVVQNKI